MELLIPMLAIKKNFAVKPVRMDTKKKKDVYYINGYEYTREGLDVLETLLVGNGNLP